MRTKAIRNTCLILVVAMICAFASACTPAATPTTAATPEPTKQVVDPRYGQPAILRETPPSLEYTDDISPITISAWYNQVVTDSWTWGNEVEKKITELTGVTLEGTYATDTSGNDLTLMLASGQALPDIINGVGLSSVQLKEMIDGELIYPLNELIDQYCPKMWNIMDDYAKTKADKDGNLWYFAKGAVTKAGSDNYPLFNGWFAARKDIIEALGNPPLNTIDDMWAFLKLWETNKAKWPEIKYPIYIPAMTSKVGNGRPFYNSFGGHLTYDASFDMIYDKKTDTVHYWFEDDIGYKTLKLEFDLAQAGYISPDSFAIGAPWDAVKAGSMLLYTGENVWPVMYNSELAKNVPGASYARIAPISVSKDVKVSYGNVSGFDWGQGVVVTKSCKNPERTIKFLEFLQSDYGSQLVYAGIPGTHYELAPLVEAKKTTYPKYIGTAADATKRPSLGIYEYTKLWFNTYGDYDLWSFGANLPDMPDMAMQSAFVGNDYYDYVPASSMNSVAPDSDEGVLRSKLDEIIGNYQTKMILAKDQTEFDKLYNELLATLNSNGLQKLKDFVLSQCHDIIKTKEAQGVVFK